MNKVMILVISFLLSSAIQGCGAGVVFQASQADLMDVTFDEAKSKAIQVFAKARPSIGMRHIKSFIQINEDGFQVTREHESYGRIGRGPDQLDL